jgi:hypothetical protein
MKLRALKYISPFLLYLGAFWAFSTTGWEVWILFSMLFIIPLLELFIKPNASNLNAAEEKLFMTDHMIFYYT